MIRSFLENPIAKVRWPLRQTRAIQSGGRWTGRHQRRLLALHLLCDIWEASLKLNQLIREFDRGHDDLKRPPAPKVPQHDPRRLSLIGD